jgi:hypothetical protein
LLCRDPEAGTVFHRRGGSFAKAIELAAKVAPFTSLAIFSAMSHNEQHVGMDAAYAEVFANNMAARVWPNS